VDSLAKENIIMSVTKPQLSSPLKLNHLQVLGTGNLLPIRLHDVVFNHKSISASKSTENRKLESGSNHVHILLPLLVTMTLL
jgi:hypothetical protein